MPARTQVGDERREWRNGEMMLFDTSVLHRAANDAAVDRYVLMLRVWHPELTPAERDALQFVFDAIDEPDLVSGDGADDARLAVLRGHRARAADALFGAGGSAVPGGAPRVAAAHAKAKAADGGKAKRRKKGKKAKGFGG